MRAFLACLIFVTFNLQAQNVTPDAIAPDGSRYYGQLREGKPHGQGRLVALDGTTYTGEFFDGRFHGNGRIQRPDGEAYDAQFVDGRMTGRGPSVLGSRADDEAERQQIALNVETALLRQRPLLDAALTSMREALQAIAARMDRENDILFVFLTSHGTKEHEFRLNQHGMLLRGLRPADLGQLLRETGIRWKAVVVSACYAGGFLDPLKDDRTLVIAAARHDRQSFGCTDQSEFTWFGRAFFKDALGASGSFEEAFGKALALVAEREQREKIAEAERSLPQIHNPRPINDHLRRWWSQFKP